MSNPVELGADDKPQLVIPGAERVAPARMAQRAADAPLKPNKPQASCDIGLFSDDANQKDFGL